METNKKKSSGKKPKLIQKPYLTGSPVDRTTIRSGLTVFAMLAVMMILFLLLGAVFMFDNDILRLALNGIVLFTCYLMFFYYGLSSGTQAVNHAEIMYNRRETGREVTQEEVTRCYHPLKGLIGALLGSIPLLLCAVVLAIIAKRQTTGIGVLPSWVSGMTSRAEIGEPLAFYSVPGSLGLEGVLRLIARMSLMPWVNIFNPNDSYAMLLLERLSPLFLMLPAFSYGVGYTQGPRTRAQVHGDIAASKRKRSRKDRRQKGRIVAQKKPVKAPKGPEQLN